MAENEKVNLHQGHRQRMKNRFLEHGLEIFDEYQLLEIMMFYAVPKKDTNEMAHLLINHFGSLCDVMRADYEDLMEVKGIGENAASLIKFIQLFSQKYLSMDFEQNNRISLGSCAPATEYCKTLYLGENKESFYVIALDAELRPVKTKQLFVGTPDTVAVSPRAIAEFVMKYKCGAVIISHNHPNGSSLPSRNDSIATQRVYEALRSMHINLVEHVIVGRDGTTCMSQCAGWKS